MNKIIRIYFHKKNTNICDVHFSDDKKITIDNSYLDKYSLFEGEEISDEKLKKVIAENEYDRAKEKAFFLLTYRDHSVNELKTKLMKRNFGTNVIEKTIEYLLKNGYLDDKKFGKIYSKELIENKRFGTMIIKKKLYQKRLGIEIIDELLNGLDDDILKENCEYHFNKKLILLEKNNSENIKNKLYNFLSAKGFRYEIIQAVFNGKKFNKM